MNCLQGLVSVLGRVMLCFIFASSAAGNKIPNFDNIVKFMKDNGVPAPNVMLAGAIVFLLVGSLLVIVGYQARIGAGLLIVFLALASYYFHNFWVYEPNSQEHTNQMIQFMKNLSMMGAMVFIVANGSGRLSLDNYFAKAVGENQ